MLRLALIPACLVPICLSAVIASAAVAQPAPPPPGPPPGYDDPDAGPPPQEDGPPVGYDAGYDYSVANDPASDADPYYQYPGPPPTDPRAREQWGLRDGVLAITPRTSYYAGVTLYGDGYGYGYGYGGYDYGYDHGCGCARYRRRYTVYSDDFGIRGASYRGYDYHRRDDRGRGYPY